jgi:hypothetical protein
MLSKVKFDATELIFLVWLASDENPILTIKLLEGVIEIPL